MNEERSTRLLASLQDALALTSVVEILAVGFGIAYLLLAVREHITCWYAAFIGTALSVYLFWNVSLLMESALNVYYLAMAVYGWHQWRNNDATGGSTSLPITSWPGHWHALALLGIVIAAGLSGFLLEQGTTASWPYLDSLTTWGSVFTTYLVAKKVLENWFYWFAIDALSIFLYWDKELYLYAILFAAYLVIVVFGYLNWRRSYNQV